MKLPIFLLIFTIKTFAHETPLAVPILPGAESPTTTTTVMTTTTTVDPCLCPNDVFDEDVMEGYVKSLDSCDMEYMCETVVKPKKGYVVIMDIEYFAYGFWLCPFYYNGSTKKEDTVFLRHQEYFDTYVTPEDFGFYWQLHRTNTYSTGFSAKFTRIQRSELTSVCPQPYLTLGPTPQILDMVEMFLKDNRAGCAFRLTSPHPIHIRIRCRRGINVNMNYANTTLRFIEDDFYSDDWIYPPASLELDVHRAKYGWYYDERSQNSPCTISVFSLDYDPCNCSTTSYNLNLNTPVTLSSPGYPKLLCQQAICQYSFSSSKAVDDGSRLAFVVNALHKSRNVNDTLLITTDALKTDSQLTAVMSNKERDAVYVTDKMTVLYAASTVLSFDHGFIMNVTAVHIPKECLCYHGHIDKVLEGSSFSMIIPSHCSIVHCRFKINNHQTTDGTQLFRMEVDHYFPQIGEKLVINAGQVHHTHFEDNGRRANKTRQSIIDYIVNFNQSAIGVYYSRVGNDSALNDSHFKLTWKWLTQADCSCDLYHDWAEPQSKGLKQSEYRSLYSPKYPDNYCNNMNCTYHIEAHEGFHIELSLGFFETEPFRDILRIFNGSPNDTDLTEIRRLSGFIRNSPVITTGGNATLVFTSDDTISHKGFSVLFRAIRNPVTVQLESTVASASFLWIFLGILGFIATVAVGSFIVYRKTTRRDQNEENPNNAGFQIKEIVSNSVD